MRNRMLAIAAVLVLCVLMLTGCSSSGEKEEASTSLYVTMINTHVPMEVSYDPAGLPSFRYDQDAARSQQRLWKDAHASSNAEWREPEQEAGSFAEGKEVRDILWPHGVKVLSVRRWDYRSTIFREGDRLLVRYQTVDPEKAREEMLALVKSGR